MRNLLRKHLSLRKSFHNETLYALCISGVFMTSVASWIHLDFKTRYFPQRFMNSISFARYAKGELDRLESSSKVENIFVSCSVSFSSVWVSPNLASNSGEKKDANEHMLSFVFALTFFKTVIVSFFRCGALSNVMYSIEGFRDLVQKILWRILAVLMAS